MLESYKEEFGDCLVAAKYKTEVGFKLGSWVHVQRATKDQLSEKRLKLLNEISFIWEPNQAQWDQNYSELVSYKNEFGNCLVSFNYQVHETKLGRWVSRQRSKKETLRPDQVKRLDDIGFVWKVK